ncbi:hypothetical protein H4219_003000 [Mycoemilia scoparia]|uniref:Uncharacterized protein n=1 Tax=Mycoemilia scoparia TaxID=417184 RepID=A0A9W8DPV8_9FUNG|nr:hypothetical protein H4219_003000 [Mycoemilia scoparia]
MTSCQPADTSKTSIIGRIVNSLNCPLDQALPFDLLAQIFIFAQCPSLAYVSEIFYEVSLSPSTRARYFLCEFGKTDIFHPNRGLLARRPRMFRQDTVILLLSLGGDPCVHEQWIFRYAVSQCWIPTVRKLMSMRKEVINRNVDNTLTLPSQNATSSVARTAEPLYPREDMSNWRSIGQEPMSVGQNTPKADSGQNSQSPLKVVSYEPVINIHHGEEEALILASSLGHLPIVNMLLGVTTATSSSAASLQSDIGISVFSPNSAAPLHTQADVHAQNDEALASAAKMGHLDVVLLLIEHGADVNAEDARPLRLAVLQGDSNLPCILAILQAGADVHAGNESCLLAAAFRGDGSSNNKSRQESGDNSSAQPASSGGNGGGRGRGSTPRYQPRRYRHDLSLAPKLEERLVPSYIKTTSLLLEWGANVHIQNDHPLRLAAWKGHVQTAKVLLDHGGDLHTENDCLIREAASHGHLELVKLFAERGANVAAANSGALRSACRSGHTEVVKYLLTYHKSNMHPEDIKASLKLAVRSGWIEIVRLFIEAGENIRDDSIWPFVIRNQVMRRALGITDPQYYL